jgi:Fibronectin type III domain
VNLAWDPNPTSEPISGYRVHYSTASGDYTNSIDVGNSTESTIQDLEQGVTYHITITAYDASGLEGDFSNSITYTPGVQTVQMRMTPVGEVALTMTGAIGHTYYIEATEDLKTWTTIGTVAMTTGSPLGFTDVNAGSYSRRFYRTVDPQP